MNPGTRGRKRATRAQQQLMRVFLTQVNVLSVQAEPGLNRLWETLGKQAAAAYRALPKSGPDGGRKGVADADLVQDQHDAERVLRSMAIATVEDNLHTLIERQHIKVMTQTVDTVNAVFDLGVNLPDHKARQIIAEGGKRVGLIDISKDTKTAIFRALVDGRVLGEGQDAMARRIRHEVPAGRFVNAGPRYRSKLIARTETKWAQNQSAMATYEVAGATHVIAFDAQGRGDSDPDCEARNGQTFPIDQAQDELGNEHPNGTLSFAPVFT